MCSRARKENSEIGHRLNFQLHSFSDVTTVIVFSESGSVTQRTIVEITVTRGTVLINARTDTSDASLQECASIANGNVMDKLTVKIGQMN